MPRFHRHIGIDYSGAETAESSLPGLRVFEATAHTDPVQVPPPPSPRKHWTRAGLADWLTRTLLDGPPAIVGIDHGFSFPIRYFEKHRVPPDWDVFLDDFQKHWPTDEPNVYVDFIRDGMVGCGHQREGNSRWRRFTEERVRGAKSVFHFDVPGSVAKSTHAGLPWLRRLRRETRDGVHFWPFDGWEPPTQASVVAEVYPSLWSRLHPREGRTADEHDAWSVARWLRRTDLRDELATWFHPDFPPGVDNTLRVEGWILGVA